MLKIGEKYMTDGHMHLEYGQLSVDYVLQFVKQAKAMGLDTIQILDHTHRFLEFSPIYEELKLVPYQKTWLEKKILEPLSSYHNLIEEVKKLKLDINVKFGLEVCYVPKHQEYIKEVLSNYNYDFVVGAVHSIDGLLYDMGFSNEILWDKYDIDYIYKRYYELVFSLVKSGLFTQLAHCDTIKMFGHYPSYDLTPTYLELCKLLKKYNVLAENNTGCHYRYNHKDIGLSDELLEIFKSQNVKIITASDAHFPQDVGKFISHVHQKS